MFSHNTGSEEIISRHLSSLEAQKGGKDAKKVKALLGSGEVNANQVSVPFTPIVKSLGRNGHNCGNDKVSNSKDTDTAPPGFEVNQGTKASAQPQKKTKSKQGRCESCSESIGPQTSSSNDTTESMLKLAQESIQVGEMLGVRIIGNKRAAVERITDHLKIRKAQRKKSSKLSKQI